ncbi:MAG: YybH family protein [Planctomycetaceae bacterium]
MKKTLLSLFVLLSMLTCPLWAEEAAEPSSPEAEAIRKVVSSYVEAFNKRDAEALAKLWSPEAVYLNRTTGEEVVGREAISKQFAEFFKGASELKLSVTTESIQLISPNVAMERGTSQLVAPKSEPEVTDYTAIYVKRDGHWLLDRITDDTKVEIPSHYEHLKVLEWMVGSWGDQDEGVQIQTDCKWAKNQNFLVRSFSLVVGDQIDTSGMQIIGWDPAAKTIRSWTFDSNGAFAEATWKKKGDSWYISNRGVLPDGRLATMVNVMKVVDKDSFTWETIERTAGGELLPNIQAVTVVRNP